MKITFIHKQGSPLPKDVLALGNTPESVWNATLGKAYTVYGMSVWTREVPGLVPWTAVIHYLIIDDTHYPSWYPAPLFDVRDSQLPYGWHYGFWGNEPGYQVQAVWGYRELATDKGQHYTALMERESGAVSVFQKRREEIDAECG